MNIEGDFPMISRTNKYCIYTEDQQPGEEGAPSTNRYKTTTYHLLNDEPDEDREPLYTPDYNSDATEAHIAHLGSVISAKCRESKSYPKNMLRLYPFTRK